MPPPCRYWPNFGPTARLSPCASAAGHALRTIGTPEARRALFDLIEDSDRLSVYLAVAATFDEDSAAAFDRLVHYFDPGRIAQPGRGRNPQCRPGDFRSGLICRRTQRGTDPPVDGLEGAVLAAAGPALGQTVRRPAARQASGAQCPACPEVRRGGPCRPRAGGGSGPRGSTRRPSRNQGVWRPLDPLSPRRTRPGLE